MHHHCFSSLPNNKDNNVDLFWKSQIFPGMVQPQFRAHLCTASVSRARSLSLQTLHQRGAKAERCRDPKAVQEQSVAAATNTSCDLTGLRVRGSASRASLSPAPSAHPRAVSSD